METVSSDNNGDHLQPAANKPKFLLCLFLDGLGIAPKTEANAVTAAKMPNFFRYVRDYPVTLLSGNTKDPRRRYWSLGCGQPDGAIDFLKADICLSEVISRAGKRQVKIAASEQFPWLSIFFNNGKETPCAGEDWICVSTPAPTEPLKPLGRDLVRALTVSVRAHEAAVIFAGLPLAQEASARGDFKETVNNLQQTDKLLPKIVDPVVNAGGVVVITAPYGNAEKTRDLAADWEDKEPTANPVPFLLIGSEYQGKTIGLTDPLDGDLNVLAPAGTLADFAPTILALLDLKKPEEMVGKSLI